MPLSLQRAALSALPAALIALTSSAGATPTLRPTAAPAAAAVDLGPTAATDTITVSLILKVQHPDALEAFVALSQEPLSPTYHKFLSTRQFADLFAPSSNDIATITRYLRSFGITVDEVYADRLVINATGTTDAFNKAFSVDVHDVNRNGRRFHRAHHAPKIPLLLRDLLVSVQGFNTEPQFKPQHHSVADLAPFATQRAVQLPKAGAGVIATGVPGQFTVGDVANLYNVNPLYQAGVTGKGRTVGIVTLAGFDPADAFLYWNLIGLKVDPNRLTQVHVDGGGPISSADGSGETCLDVEQSGGLAPDAKMVVYDAPNTDAGFIDLFYKAASDNKVDTLSVSWGESETLYFESIVGVDRTAQLTAFHQAFLELAAQGTSLFAASGDSGAFDLNTAFNLVGDQEVPNVLTVDTPGSDPAITAAGGTTIAATIDFGIGGVPPLVLPKEQVWGWDYIENFLIPFGILNPDDLFPTGGGGGVSFIWSRPLYQLFTPGIRKTEPGQSVTVVDPVDGPIDLLDLPAGFAGRNVPDVSLNADPFTGYIVQSTEDGGLLAGFGGTSFVAPQLNGITALVSQAAGGRIGLINPMLYRFKRTTSGSRAAIHDVTAGDNWFYSGAAGYNPGSGLGVLDGANFAAAVRRERH